MQPVVSVVIPTYNRVNYVLQTLDSVFAQTFTDFEIIVVNDGSSDDTAARLRPLAETGRIRYLEQPNAGHAAARNRGLAEVRGEFVAFLDDDDLWPLDKLAWQVAILREEPGVDVVYGQRTIMDGDGEPHPGEHAPEGEVLAQFASQGWIQSPGQVLIRRTALTRTGGFDPAFWGTEDWDLWLRLARSSRFRYRARPALIYRRHATNTTNNFLRMWENGHAVIRKNFAGSRGSGAGTFRRSATRFVNDFTAYDGLKRARELIGAGRLREAATALLQVGRIHRWRAVNGYYLYVWRQLVRRYLRGGGAKPA